MKPIFNLQFLIVVLLSALAMPVKSEGLNTNMPELSGLFDQKNADHLLLVAFKDQSINRIQGTATAYRKRGDYASSTWSQHVSDDIATDYHIQKLTEWPMTTVGVHCIVYQVPLNVSVPDTLRRLGQDARVDIAQNMHVFNTRAGSGTDPYFQLQSNLRTMHIDQVHAQATGKNITIAMIDTGVDLEHPDLMGQISQNENFAQSISAGFSTDKHGTAVAGIMVAKKDNGTGIMGVAPDANIIALKACWPEQPNAIEAVCNSFTLAMAVNTAIKSGAKILNMSLTGPQDALLELLLTKAITEGMIVVAADTGRGQANDNFPASMKNVIAVQSIHQKNVGNAKKQASILTAPGDKILTTLPYGTYDFLSGSSIAAAEVSGIIALLLELKPDLTLAEAQSALQKSELPAGMGYFPGINANGAALALCRTDVCQQDTLKLVFKNP
ncbi:Thermitase [Crenothrix polyspora]|uniref:Thermitase n=1 Tax=Crenothrix polyspora TaxID=360316 RepID=A0A1R4HII0_9GAMM|nr:S8 family serine peptidase [Crenothrix polyspora]SJM96044.1 Thermitase [Crenothrix polyspora]